MNSAQITPLGDVCKGAIELGSGCMRCGKCAIQLAERARGTDAQILKERELTAAAISGAIAFGMNGWSEPPEDSAWLRDFYGVGKQLAEQAKTIAGHDPVVGHKTIGSPDGSHRHEPLRKSEADALMASVEEAKRRRAEQMPTEQDAARMMFQAWYRLKELGWKETCYGPTNVPVQVIEPGSSGIHSAVRYDPWPEKTWWVEGDSPSNPCLFKPPMN